MASVLDHHSYYRQQLSHARIAADRMTACDVCAHGTAVVFCAADRANLCVKCDLEIHEANAMSARHIRVPLPVRFSSVPRDPVLIVPQCI